MKSTPPKRPEPMRPKRNPPPPNRSAVALKTVFVGGAKTHVKKER